MQKCDVAALDLPAHLVDQVVRFGGSLEGLSFAQLVALAGKLDRTQDAYSRAQVSADGTSGLDAAFLEKLAGLGAQAACMFTLVEAEIERRLSGRAAAQEI